MCESTMIYEEIYWSRLLSHLDIFTIYIKKPEISCIAMISLDCGYEPFINACNGIWFKYKANNPRKAENLTQSGLWNVRGKCICLFM